MDRGDPWGEEDPVRLGRIVDREVDLFSDGLQPNSDGLHP